MSIDKKSIFTILRPHAESKSEFRTKFVTYTFLPNLNLISMRLILYSSS